MKIQYLMGSAVCTAVGIRLIAESFGITSSAMFKGVALAALAMATVFATGALYRAR